MIKKMRIMGIDYSIDSVSDKEVEGDFGHSWTKHANIRINQSIPMDVTLETILHEVLHVIVEVQGMEQLNRERTIRMISSSLFQVLRANPDYIKILLEISSEQE
jgi:hypothetical protein